MRIRIGTTWHEAQDGIPLMVYLEPMDRLIINHMEPFANLYAQFSPGDDQTLTTDQKIAWMTTETIKAKPYVPPEQMPPEVFDPPSKVTPIRQAPPLPPDEPL